MEAVSYLNSQWVHLLVLLTVAAYLFAILDRGWIPHDAGTLGQAAERVLQGELPHRDFDDPYTGGLSFYHAGVFTVLGTSLHSIRTAFFAFSLVFASTIFWIASRLTNKWLAALITLFALAWSVPNYFDGMPSWYNLFFACFGSWAIIKYEESDKPRWLVIAGLMGGLSFLVKITGLFYIAACLLFFVYREQSNCSKASRSGDYRVFSVLSTTSLIAFVGVLALLIFGNWTVMNVIHFFLPGSILAMHLVYNEWRISRGHSLHRIKTLAAMLSWFGGGVLVPIVLFLIPYTWHSSIHDWFNGTFILPYQRITASTFSLPPTWTLVACIPVIIVLAAPLIFPRRFDNRIVVVFATLLGMVGVAFGYIDAWYQWVWYSVRPLVPTLVGLGSYAILRNATVQSAEKPNRLLFLLLAMLSMISLVQFPYSAGIYFCYAAPMLIIAYAAYIGNQSVAPKRLHLVIALFYFGFAINWMNTSGIYGVGDRYFPLEKYVSTKISRLDLRICPVDKVIYESVIAEIQSHSEHGDFIYATSDCPEIYLLAERKNPTRTFFDFFDADYSPGISDDRLARIQRMLDEHQVRVVVFYWRPAFSATSLRLYHELTQQYRNLKHFHTDPPGSATIQPLYSVAWK